MNYTKVFVFFLIGLFVLGCGIWLYKQGKLSRIISPEPTETPSITPTAADTSFLSPTYTPTSTPTDTPMPTATLYLTTFNGYLNCRQEPSTSSPTVGVIQGQKVTIKAQNENWLYVSVEYLDQPCWVLKEVIPGLDPVILTSIPLVSGTPHSTFTPPGTKPASTPRNGDDGQTPNPPVDTPQPMDTSRPIDTARPIDTPRPPKPPTPTPTCWPPGHCK